ncbi:amino acid/amide ABC transporter substrate-binding protein, HAAT family (plasmid) [Salipiger profundus]|jgi:branched-chain amino acid transport system substrate-binding protein|uniref:Amino acid/amide ABC transporter substrate-binding protein, HAAT family n=1 Tax=Salipiger profundus TaxID=1229727 RepID=A0A1U7DCD3_9RHOB|nr:MULTISPECIES: ABC transporter substrate-binding protein [Salipiger]APX25799.1 amino acid/amide ABC transporter substrate-binding protein, HAAT family [Salipiger profundus]SFC85759.1 amino acid/amide ABC transporter substrate-binding protein, HAAT family [Salipiger profundus]
MKLKALLAATAVSALVAGAAQADVKFGALFPFSGGLALLGEESFRGVELAVEEINAAGGIQGEQIELVRGDAVDNNQAIGEARRLISREGVKAILGTYSSSRSIAASQVAELSGIPYFELGAVADEVTGRDLQYLYRTNPTAETMGIMTIDMIVDKIAPGLGVEPSELKIGVIHEDSAYGTSVAGHQEEYGAEKGLNIVTVQGYPSSTVDMSSLVLDLKDRDVDVVLQTSYQNDSVLFLNQSAEAGFEPDAIIGGGGGYSLTATAEAVGDKMEGVLDVDFTQYAVNTEFTPGLEDFLSAYQDKYGEDPRSGHSLNNYVGAMAILEGIGEGEGFEPDQIVAAVEAIDIPSGETAAGYGVKFGEQNQNERAMMMGMQWQGGKLVTVYPSDAAVADFMVGD